MQNTASFSAKSQNLGSIAADKALVIPVIGKFIPVKTGTEIQSNQHLDSCFRRNDEGKAGMTKCSATPSNSWIARSHAGAWERDITPCIIQPIRLVFCF